MAGEFSTVHSSFVGRLGFIRPLLALLLVFLPGFASALHLDAALGFDGYYVPGRWTPISITVENLPRADRKNQELTDFEGTVRVASAGVSGDSAPQVFSRSLSVPANDRKRITLYAKFSARGDSAVVELVSKSGRKVESLAVPKKAVMAPQPLVPYVRTTDAAISLPKMTDLPAAQMAPLDPDRLPDKWYGYDGVSLLIIPRMLDKLLDRERAEALREWVAQGGRLLLVGGRYGESYRGSPVEPLLPGTLEDAGTYLLDAGGLQPADPNTSSATPLVQLSGLQPGAEASVHLASNGVPLLVGSQFGSGQVLFLTSDWSLRLFQAFPVTVFLNTWLLTETDFRSVGQRLDDTFPYGDAQIFGLGSASALPDMGLVSVLLIGYLVAVGPANFFLLARRKRLELAWITVPLIVGVFCFLIYALGSYIRGSGSFLRNYHLVTGRAGSDKARAETFSLVYLSEKRYDKLAPERANAAAAGHTVWMEANRRWPGWQGAAPTASSSGAGDTVQVTQDGERMALDPKLIRQWAYDFSRFDAPVDLGGPIEAELTMSGNSATISVQNGTTQPLHNLHVVLGGKAWKVEKVGAKGLDAGAAVEGKLQLDKGGQPLSGLSDPDVAKELDRTVFSAFTSTLASVDPLRPDLPPALLVGRLAEAPLDVKIDGVVGIQSHHTFFALSLPVRTEGNQEPIKLAAMGRYLGDASRISAANEGRAYLTQDPVVFAASAPVVLGVGAGTEAAVTWVKQGDGIPVRAEVYDFASWQWREVPLKARPRQEKQGPETDDFGSMGYQQELAGADADLSGISALSHPLSGGVLIRLSKSDNLNQLSGLDVAPPVIQQFVTGSPARSFP